MVTAEEGERKKTKFYTIECLQKGQQEYTYQRGFSFIEDIEKTLTNNMKKSVQKIIKKKGLQNTSIGIALGANKKKK